MAMILQRLTRALSPTVIGEIAKTAGLEPALASRGNDRRGSRGRSRARGQGRAARWPGDGVPDAPGAPARPCSASSPSLRAPAFPGAVLAPVLGARASAVGDRLDRTLGFRASSLLPVAAAVVLGLTARIVEEQELDEAGVAELLALEATELLSDAVLLAPATSVATRTDTVAAVREALETISRMKPSEAPRFRRLVEDVAACVAIWAESPSTAARESVGPRSHVTPATDVSGLRVWTQRQRRPHGYPQSWFQTPSPRSASRGEGESGRRPVRANAAPVPKRTQERFLLRSGCCCTCRSRC